MSKHVRVVAGIVVDVVDDLATQIHPDLHGAFIKAPDTVRVGMIKNGKKFVQAPEPEMPEAPVEVTTVRIVSRADFLRRMTRAERITLRSLVASDPIVADFMGLLELVEMVDLDSDDVVEGLAYLAQQGHLTEGRAVEIAA
jgi:hypothetical protein